MNIKKVFSIFKKKEPCKPCEACKDSTWSVYIPENSTPLTSFQKFYIKEVLKAVGEMPESEVSLIVDDIHDGKTSLIYGSNEKARVLYVVSDLLCEGINVMITTNNKR